MGTPGLVLKRSATVVGRLRCAASRSELNVLDFRSVENRLFAGKGGSIAILPCQVRRDLPELRWKVAVYKENVHQIHSKKLVRQPMNASQRIVNYFRREAYKPARWACSSDAASPTPYEA